MEKDERINKDLITTNPYVLPIKGLIYIKNFVTEEEANNLLTTIDSHPFEHVIRRRQQFYGETYYHTKFTMAGIQPEEGHEKDKALPIEDLQWLIDKIVAYDNGSIFEEEVPTQCLINEYVHHYGISSHFEDEQAFGKVIAMVSLINPIYFTLKLPREHTNDCQDIVQETRLFLEPRSLLVMKEDARYEWRHGISKYKKFFHPITQEEICRNENYRRISVTVRKLLGGRLRHAEQKEGNM